MDYESEFEYYSVCSCGAITLHARNGESYSCLKKNRKRFLPCLDLRKLEKLSDSCCCDHCVNHYGVDICACGSGEPFEKCENGFDVCGKPMQILGGRTCVCADDSWLKPRYGSHRSTESEVRDEFF